MNEEINAIRYGAIDIGSNSCGLLIVEIADSFSSYKIIHCASRVTRLGEKLEKTGRISETAINLLIPTLKTYNNHLFSYGVKPQHLRCVATAAFRHATNTKKIIEITQKKLLPYPEVISSKKEAWLAAAGCSDILCLLKPYAVVFDIGGRSTELAFISLNKKEQNFKLIDYISLPYGLLHLGNSKCSEKERNRVATLISFKINEFAARNNIFSFIEKKNIEIVGVSGLVLLISAIALKLPNYNRRLLFKKRLSLKEIDSAIQLLEIMTPEDRDKHPCIGKRRSDLIMGGVAIFKSIYETLNAPSVLAINRGLLEGIIYSLHNSTF